MNSFIEVPQILDRQQVNFFVDNGYLALPDFLPTEMIEEVIEELEKLAKRRYLGESLLDGSEVFSENKVNPINRILAIHKPHIISPLIRKVITYKRLAGVVSQIAGAHFPYWQGNVKCADSMIFVKPPGFPGHAWHQDESFIPTRDRSLVGAWIAIDNADVTNGCLWIIPGSHRSGYLYPMKEHKNKEEYDVHQISYGFDDSQAIPLEVNSGTAVFLNGYILHQSLKNKSNMLRRSLVIHYLSSESLLPWFKTEHGEYIATADARKVIHVAGEDPYAWKGYDDLEKDKPFVRGTN